MKYDEELMKEAVVALLEIINVKPGQLTRRKEVDFLGLLKEVRDMSSKVYEAHRNHLITLGLDNNQLVFKGHHYYDALIEEQEKSIVYAADVIEKLGEQEYNKLKHTKTNWSLRVRPKE